MINPDFNPLSIFCLVTYTTNLYIFIYRDIRINRPVIVSNVMNAAKDYASVSKIYSLIVSNIHDKITLLSQITRLSPFLQARHKTHIQSRCTPKTLGLIFIITAIFSVFNGLGQKHVLIEQEKFSRLQKRESTHPPTCNIYMSNIV